MSDKSSEEYGESFKGHLLEQYKLYVGTAESVSKQRSQANRFYVSLLSGLFAFLSIGKSFFNNSDMIFIIISLLGILFCIVWFFNIRSYKQLNKIKFKVIHEIEKNLPFPCFDREWQIEKEDRSRYVILTFIENTVPFIVLISYLFMLVYAIVNMVKK